VSALKPRRPLETEPTTDAALLEAVARDDLGALGVLYDRHAKAVWRVVHRVTNGAADVDDLVQATFLQLPKLAAGFDGRPSARSWLIGIAVRLSLRHLRGMGRFTRMLARFAHVTRRDDTVDPEAHAAGRGRLRIVERALTDLSPAKRAVFILVEMEGLTHDEVARELAIPLATVRTRLFHAKRALVSALAQTEGA
jgi:RNA polymerase sigma-70 factor (ECF subfamily)